ncbi:unnamed protein product [Boreogadus saida]
MDLMHAQRVPILPEQRRVNTDEEEKKPPWSARSMTGLGSPMWILILSHGPPPRTPPPPRLQIHMLLLCALTADTWDVWKALQIGPLRVIWIMGVGRGTL